MRWTRLVDASDVQVGDLLDLGELGRDLVLADVAVLLDATEVIDLVAPDVANRDAGVLRLAVEDLHEVLPALFGQLWDGDPYDLPVVARVEPEVALLDGLLDGGE